jgi:hypothetical protein
VYLRSGEQERTSREPVGAKGKGYRGHDCEEPKSQQDHVISAAAMDGTPGGAEIQRTGYSKADHRQPPA